MTSTAEPKDQLDPETDLRRQLNLIYLTQQHLDTAAEEKSCYHSVSHRDNTKVEFDDKVPPSSYTLTELAEPYNIVIENEYKCVEALRIIPQDGRIYLPSDLRWLVRQAEHEERMLHLEKSGILGRCRLGEDPPASMVNALLYDADANAKIAIEEAVRFRQGTMIKDLQSFFCEDFKKHGSFTIRDVDPESEYHLLYYPSQRFPVFRCPGATVAVDLVSEPKAFSRWLMTQKDFCAKRPPNSQIAPWQRLILCQGLSLASRKAKEEFCFPFLTCQDKDDPIKMAASLHLSGDRRGGTESANPYLDPHNAFHITFFETLPSSLGDCRRPGEIGRDLRIGQLYDLPRYPYSADGPQAQTGWLFRQSSFTVITATRRAKRTAESGFWSDRGRYWTMLILSPTDFFKVHQIAKSASVPDGEIEVGSEASHRVAELSCIVSAMKKVEERWRKFDEYMSNVLVEDFMDPTEYCKLLFDDAKFSRSRRYFWILGCLNEFDVLLEDNIKQWRLYRRARLEAMLERHRVGKFEGFDGFQDGPRLRELDQQAQDVRQGLEYLRAEFKAKQDKVKGLRDGLFNASALMESRSSTRLGMNVQLLTYVSIFYLPLAFCAALWAIPNITDGGTRSPFIATAILVGAATYAIVFNLENIAGFFGELYQGRKERLLHGMKNDSKEFWHDVGDRFEEFPPSEERKPSEWWLLRYAVSSLFRREGPKSSNDNKEDA